jgi:hypothetical protein
MSQSLTPKDMDFLEASVRSTANKWAHRRARDRPRTRRADTLQVRNARHYLTAPHALMSASCKYPLSLQRSVAISIRTSA